MALDKATVSRIAHLARIQVPDEQLEPLAAELGQILTWVEQLNEVDTTDVPPMTGVAAQKLRWRADTVTDGRVQDQVLTNAPESAAGFYAVPKVVE